MLRVKRQAGSGVHLDGLRLTSFAVGEPAVAPATDTIVRDFSDPFLEMVRLLREAAEIEHALMVQYLYAAFSVKADRYPRVFGIATSSATSLLGVAIQEMEHLHTVNQLLVELGAAPGLVSQEFPYEPDIYPFPLHLEPLSQKSLAKYVYTEAPANALQPEDPQNSEELPFLELLKELLGGVRPNHLGSLYSALLARGREISEQEDPDVPDLAPWMTKLAQIKGEGEDDHFRFFKEVFLGTHPGFGGRPVWTLPIDDPDYPALDILIDPSAYEGHPHEIRDRDLRRVAFLGDLQYWIVLLLLGLSYRHPEVPFYVSQAKNHMRFPLKELGSHLATSGAGLPFDPLAIGYAPGVNQSATVKLLRRFLRESKLVTRDLGAVLPENYSSNTDDDTLSFLGT